MENQKKAKEYKKKLVRLATLILNNRNRSQEGFTKRRNVSAALEKGEKNIVDRERKRHVTEWQGGVN